MNNKILAGILFTLLIAMVFAIVSCGAAMGSSASSTSIEPSSSNNAPISDASTGEVTMIGRTDLTKVWRIEDRVGEIVHVCYFTTDWMGDKATAIACP
jgi:hypothetical protein